MPVSLTPVAVWGVNSIIQYRSFFRYTNDDNFRMMGVLNYRCNEGGNAWNKVNCELLFQQFKQTVLDPIVANLPDSMECFRTDMQTFAWENSPSVVWPMTNVSDLPLAGGLTPVLDEETLQRAAGCLVRQSFRTGRKSMGRFFFGPLMGRFVQNTAIDIDPTGPGDLNDVDSALIANCVNDVDGVSQVLKPCIMGFAIDENGRRNISREPDPLDDVRLQYWSTQLSYLRSRKPLVGM